MKKFLLLAFLCTQLFSKTITVNSDNHILLRGEVDSGMSDAVTVFLAEIKQSKQKEAIIVIDSPGGSVLDGGIIVDAIKASKVPTVCVVRGLAASMAAMLLENCTKRYATTTSIIMFHDASAAVGGDLENMKSRVTALDKLTSLLENAVAHRLEISFEEYKKRASHEWWVMGAKEALKYKVIDSEVQVELELPKKELLNPLVPSDITGKKSSESKNPNNDRRIGITGSQPEILEVIKNFKLE